MKVLKNFEVKEQNDCVAGELVRFGYDSNSYLGVIVHVSKDDVFSALVLDSTDPKFPLVTMNRFNVEGRCVSYGSDWLLEPLDGEETWPGNAAEMDEPGTLRCFPGSTGIVSRGVDDRLVHLNGLIEIEKLRRIQRERYEGALVTRWQIWANEEHRDRVGATPVFEFPAKRA